MEKVIKAIESRRDCVVDVYHIIGDEIHADVRIVRHDFEYCCRVVFDKHGEFIADYKFLWSWHTGRKNDNGGPKVHHSTSIQATRSKYVPSGQNIAKPVRRRVVDGVFA